MPDETPPPLPRPEQQQQQHQPPPLPQHVLSYEVGHVPMFSRPRLHGGVWLALAIAFTVATVGLFALVTAALWNGVSPLAGLPAPVVGLFLLAVASGVLIATRRGRVHAVL